MIITLILNIFRSILSKFHRRWKSTSNIDPTGRYVFISGCDSGIGHDLAIELDQIGFNVIVTVLNLNNIQNLKSKLSTRATVIRLDIRKQEDIDSAYNTVRSITSTLHALVNNAGIITHGCIDWMSMETIRQLMDVNFFGHVAVTKAFLPLLISKENSRIVNMGSATGFFVFPQTSAYSASKHALRSFSDCLRREMGPWGVRVSIIEPGTLNTGMLDSFVENLNVVWNGLTSETKKRWGENYLKETINSSVNSPFMKHPDDPKSVIRDIKHAIIADVPRLHYRPGWQSKLIFYLFYLSPAWMIDALLIKGWALVPDDVRLKISN